MPINKLAQAINDLNETAHYLEQAIEDARLNDEPSVAVDLYQALTQVRNDLEDLTNFS